MLRQRRSERDIATGAPFFLLYGITTSKQKDKVPIVYSLKSCLRKLKRNRSLHNHIAALADFKDVRVALLHFRVNVELVAKEAFEAVCHFNALGGRRAERFEREGVEQHFDIADGIDVSVDVKVAIHRLVRVNEGCVFSKA